MPAGAGARLHRHHLQSAYKLGACRFCVALRSVVVQPPPPPSGPRKTVVLRVGAPQQRGHWADVATGILGVLLLVGAIALGQILPDRTYLNPQFRFSAFEQTAEADEGSLTFYFEDAGENVHEFKYNIPVDNVTSIRMSLGFEDDVSYSLPDRFLIDLYDPAGNFYGHAEMQNKDPSGGSGPTEHAMFYLASQEALFPIAPPLQEQIVTGLTHTELPEQVLARLAPEYHVPTKGEWTVRVVLVAAGDCPAPGQATYPQQPLDCRVARPDNPNAQVAEDGVDPGNIFRIASFVYSYYIPQVEEL